MRRSYLSSLLFNRVSSSFKLRWSLRFWRLKSIASRRAFYSALVYESPNSWLFRIMTYSYCLEAFFMLRSFSCLTRAYSMQFFMAVRSNYLTKSTTWWPLPMFTAGSITYCCWFTIYKSLMGSFDAGDTTRVFNYSSQARLTSYCNFFLPFSTNSPCVYGKWPFVWLSSYLFSVIILFFLRDLSRTMPSF